MSHASISKLITAYEHDSVQIVNEGQLAALRNYHGEKGCNYFTLTSKGIKLTEYVGVIQVGSLVIEVLPKADKAGDSGMWPKTLIEMIRKSDPFDLRSPGNAELTIRTNSILHLYFEIFLSEAENLLHKGLVKKYKKTEGNLFALKGSLDFAKNIQLNITNQERFYVNYDSFSVDNVLNKIILKTVKLLSRINTNPLLQRRIGSLLLNFPELQDIKVTEGLFDNIVYGRKTEPYKRAISIAEMLLLQYHPDLKNGRNDVLALMFDMNLLWEKFVYKSLVKHWTDVKSIRCQAVRSFWKSENGDSVNLKPDIVVSLDGDKKIVIDTKWKILSGTKPSSDDLQQMYAYSKYHGNAITMLVYPSFDGNPHSTIGGFVNANDDNLPKINCYMNLIPVNNNVAGWQRDIADNIISCLSI